MAVKKCPLIQISSVSVSK